MSVLDDLVNGGLIVGVEAVDDVAAQWLEDGRRHLEAAIPEARHRYHLSVREQMMDNIQSRIGVGVGREESCHIGYGVAGGDKRRLWISLTLDLTQSHTGREGVA